MNVSDIMVEPVRIEKSEYLSRALDLMDKYDTRRLMVTSKGILRGVLTMRNIARALGTSRKSGIAASSLHVATAVSNTCTVVPPDMDVDDAIPILQEQRGILIVQDNGEILGWVTPQEILQTQTVFGFAAEFMNKAITASPGDRVVHVRRTMMDHNIGRLPVLEDYRLVGIITEKDIAKAMRAIRGLVSTNQQDTRVKNLLTVDIMSRGVRTVYTNSNIPDVVNLMLRYRYGGIPVLNLDEDLVGFITRRDVVAKMHASSRT
ncbi:MAG: CBS domain-containing protein [Candidatus Methanogaster sp.]|uniref:CBS domain-containing protein n=1 Tax=Candidatus Methanogaster sp. TaxID=3386292 RepID=A0AC61L6F2_9EURY|nr:MAG: CBS domain-containing protein [ANME-2 cluster archaeon]